MTKPRKIYPAAALILTIAILVTILPRTETAYAAVSSNLSVSLSGNVLAASRNNTLSIEILNVGKYLKELDVALTIPPPLVLFGDNHWIRSSFSPRDVIRANLTVFAPTSAAGAALQGNVVAVYKVIGEQSPSTETHAISFLVRGWIDIIVYEITVSPDPALPGGEITISGNILNRGVIAAMYANVSLAPDPPLLKDSVKPAYVGQVDPNAPAPFSVTAVVDSAATEGRYQATILVYYRDDLQLDRAVAIPTSYTVIPELPKTETTETGLIEQVLSNPGQLLSNPGLLLSNQMVMLGLAILLILVVVGIYLRRRRKATET
jgi:hypothetical protein